ncbi:mitochondrial ribosomal protein L37-domain-containing protein [Biscogniauxia mediterranea]|nr:mitochondrial ribosomal protein L37-domain-containing protein [Biscogniauxia mediterranea]
MICRQCLQRASALSSRIPQLTPALALPVRRSTIAAVVRPFSSTLANRSAAAPTPASPEPEPEPATSDAAQPPPPSFGTADSAEGAAPKAALSSCPEGSILVGLNYFKNRTDPVALADSEYPEWLWRCLDVSKKVSEEDAEDAGDEFSKSRKQRRLAMKRQRAYEARLLAEGNLEALAPKIPLQHQSINLPSNEEGTPEGALAALAAREELRRAMRRERKAMIKESNYLKSM